MDEPIAFSTAEIADDKRLEVFTDVFERSVMPCTIKRLTDDPFWGEIAIADFGSTTILELAASPTHCMSGAIDALDSHPGLMLDVVFDGRYALNQNGSTGEVAAGGAIFWHNQLPSDAVSPVATRSRSIMVPDTALQGITGDTDALACLAVRPDIAELDLLRFYLRSMDVSTAAGSSGLRQVIGNQLSDLVVSMVARMMRKDDPSEGRGVKAARLKAIRTLVERNFGSPTLSVTRVARQLGVSERYVQKLLDETGTSFGKLLMETRLDAARRTLETAPPSQSIGTVAEACGFSDASHFTRAFRQRFGGTPSAVRGSGGPALDETG
jgi:AraC-like DNA-binding protein